MRVLHWDDGGRWDDVNARWGDPSYVLEPGDPGYQFPVQTPGASNATETNHRIMSSNATPKSRVVLIARARAIHAGQVSKGDEVGLHHHKAPAMLAAIQKLAGDPAAAVGTAARKGTQLIYRMAVDATGEAEKARRDLSNGAVKTWLEGYKGVIEGVHGKKSNAGWVSAGFPSGSTAIPRDHEQRQEMLATAQAYLSAHPDQEVTLPQPAGQPPLAITSAQATTLHTAMQTAQNLIASRQSDQENCKLLRDADEDALFDEVSATIAELRDRLAADSPLWEFFGLNIPAHPNPPGGVESLTVEGAGTGKELLRWTFAVRAEYYRIFLKRIGTDTEAQNIDDAYDLEYTLKDLTPGTTIEVYVIPMNDGGAGEQSPTVTKVVGA